MELGEWEQYEGIFLEAVSSLGQGMQKSVLEEREMCLECGGYTILFGNQLKKMNDHERSSKYFTFTYLLAEIDQWAFTKHESFGWQKEVVFFLNGEIPYYQLSNLSLLIWYDHPYSNDPTNLWLIPFSNSHRINIPLKVVYFA